MELIWIIVVGTSIWVWMDARSIGAKKGLVDGIADMGPFAWFICCLLLWLIAFPVYLAKRSKIKDAALKAEAQELDVELPFANRVEMKLCPFCAEQIKAAAIKCRHCGSEIPLRRNSAP